MKVPLSWLKEFVDIEIPAEELAKKLTFAGLEVEEMDYIGLPAPKGASVKINSGLAWDRERIVIGQLREVKPHPNADRLTLAVVDYGRSEPIQVVTGAPNIKPGDRGQKVVLALRGAQLYDGHKEGQVLMILKEAVLRGIKNDSMVCSEKELGLSQEHEGILLLPDDAPVGIPLADYLGDVVFEIKINPNMARCQSVRGVAREVSALTNKKLKTNSQAFGNGKAETDFVKIEIADPKLCPRFSAWLIRNLTIKPSPFRMQRRLVLAGMRPINNVVDITNYAMIETGKPLHAFDYDKLCARAKGHKPTILVRPARVGEKMQTLDGASREFKATDVLVTDAQGPVGIAGIMGGAETEVSQTTKNILLESAIFDFISIRRTAQEQKLPSEAATRFGRGIPPAENLPGALRAADLMRSLAGGQVEASFADNYPVLSHSPTVEISSRQVTRQVGVAIPSDQIVSILQALDFQVRAQGGEAWSVIPPEYRTDVDGAEDVIEEIARVYGYEKIPSTPLADALPPLRGNLDLEREERVHELLTNEGLQQIITYSLTNAEHEARILPASSDGTGEDRWGLPAREYVRIENYIAPERSMMRQMLLPGVLDILASNWRQRERVALYEIGPVYLTPREEEREQVAVLPEDKGLNLPLEPRRLALALWGAREPMHWGAHTQTPMDFYDLKGVVEALFEGLHQSRARYVPSAHPSFQPGRAATVLLDELAVGVLGELHPRVRAHFDLPEQTVLVAEFDLEAMLAKVSEKYQVQALSPYPVVKQDLALVVDEELDAQRVSDLIRQSGGALLTRLDLFDVYHGDQIPLGKKSLAYSLTFQSGDKVLTDLEIAKVRERIVARAKRELRAELRGG